jgi:hypothetical protein
MCKPHKFENTFKITSLRNVFNGHILDSQISTFVLHGYQKAIYNVHGVTSSGECHYKFAFIFHMKNSLIQWVVKSLNRKVLVSQRNPKHPNP